MQAYRRLASKLHGVKRIVAVALLLSLTGCSDEPRGINLETRAAPAGSFAERRTWAERTFPVHFPIMVQYARNSPFIREKLGPVRDVSLLGENYCQDFFTDGRMAYLTAEIKGDKSRGLLQIRALTTFSSAPAWFFWEAPGAKQTVEEVAAGYLLPPADRPDDPQNSALLDDKGKKK